MTHRCMDCGSDNCTCGIILFQIESKKEKVMKKEQFYFILCGTEDGGYVKKLTKQELEEELGSEEDGGVQIPVEGIMDDIRSSYSGKKTDIVWFEDWPTGKTLIIKGEIIVPIPIEKITKWEID